MAAIDRLGTSRALRISTLLEAVTGAMIYSEVPLHEPDAETCCCKLGKSQILTKPSPSFDSRVRPIECLP